VPDPQHLLRSGMNVTVDFKAGELKNVLVVPTGASVQQNNSQGVFVAKDKGDSVFMPIVVGTTVNDKTEVKSGLSGNEHVLLSFPPGKNVLIHRQIVRAVHERAKSLSVKF
jgi:HlyD family secretion protein